MPMFYFPVEYNGNTFRDDRGEEFSTADEAQAYAALVAYELGRNYPKAVVVLLSDQEGTLLAKVLPTLDRPPIVSPVNPSHNGGKRNGF
jgi:hypothetical protein